MLCRLTPGRKNTFSRSEIWLLFLFECEVREVIAKAMWRLHFHGTKHGDTIPHHPHTDFREPYLVGNMVGLTNVGACVDHSHHRAAMSGGKRATCSEFATRATLW